MNTSTKPTIALISVHGDPAIEIGREEAGGQNVYVRQVGEALAQQGWQVDMFTRRADAEASRIVQHSPNCRTIRLTAGSEEFIPRQEILEYCGDFVEEFIQFQEQEGKNYKLVHTNYWLSGWVGLELKKRLGIPMIHTYHSLGAVKYKSMQTIPMIASTRLQVEKNCLETADCTVATSPQEREHTRSRVSRKGNIQVIPCGTDIHRFGSIDYHDARAQLGIEKDAKVIFYIGRFDPRKGIETLVRAVGQSKLRGEANLKLILGGGSRPDQSDGKERDRIQGIVNELNMNSFTTFPGRIDDDQLPVYYAAADVCVVPSHYEPFGLVAIEAMASATPVVASDVGGLQYTVVPEETGLLASPQDADAFAKAIDRLLQNPEWRKQLGINGQKRVQDKFSWEGVSSQLSDLYNEIIEIPTVSFNQVSA